MINRKSVIKSFYNLNKFIERTPLEFNNRLSKLYNCNIYFKREDKQLVRSFKVRGALNKILNLKDSDKKNGIVCASAGNHAQGFAYSCNKLNLKGDIFVPENTPLQKINRIKDFSNNTCNLHVFGNNFNECLGKSLEFANENNKSFIHPYDDYYTIEGQGTIAKEIYDEINPDYILGCIGGGGLISGIGLYAKNIHINNYKENDVIFEKEKLNFLDISLGKNLYKNIKIIGVEPSTCPSMYESIKNKSIVELEINDTFVDGATVSKVGNKTFNICSQVIDDIYISNVGKICETMLELYQEDGIIVEPAGALSVSALDQLDRNKIKDKNIVCVISGGNNDITRYPEVIERCLRYQGLKHYFIVKFLQKPGELKKFINNILGKDDDITRFEYMKKTNKEYGNVLIGIQLGKKENIINIEKELFNSNFEFIKINENDLLYSYLI